VGQKLNYFKISYEVKMKIVTNVILIAILLINVTKTYGQNDEQLKEKAQMLAQKYLIIDTHIDLPYELGNGYYDVSVKGDQGQFDYQRAIDGGLNAAFMSIYIPTSYEDNGAKAKADSLIDLVYNLTKKYPNKFILADSPESVKKQFSNHRISFPMGMENGAPIEGDLHNLKYFYDKGIRYITLCHVKNNHICDSSGDDTLMWNGLSPFGEKVVNEMNRLGIMIDISHVADSTFYDVIGLSKAPVIASHSGCRALTPGYKRNMTDDMIKQLGNHGGVIQIFFGSYLVNNEFRLKSDMRDSLRKSYLADHPGETVKEFNKKFPLGNATIEDVVKQIDHVVKLVGIDHVGLGSDFDGVGLVPEKLKDVSCYPNLIYELIKRGYSDKDIEKICSGNLLRVWSEVEKYTVENKK
jgi:membrane dipeptidase